MWLSWFGHRPENQRLQGWFLVRAQAWVVGSFAGCTMYERLPVHISLSHQCFSSSLSPSLPLSLKSIQEKSTKKLELSSGEWAPHSIGFPCRLSVLGTHLYQCTSWCCGKRLHSASVNFFWRFFQCICLFHNGWFMILSAHTMLSIQQFLTKMSWPLCPILPIHPVLPQAAFVLFCFPRWKKSSEGKVLPTWKR